jgi:hypothetical protein
MCAGWRLGWLSTTIARQVYPPPRCEEALSGVRRFDRKPII